MCASMVIVSRQKLAQLNELLSNPSIVLSADERLPAPSCNSAKYHVKPPLTITQNKGTSPSGDGHRKSTSGDANAGTSGSGPPKKEETESVVHNKAMSKAVKVNLES